MQEIEIHRFNQVEFEFILCIHFDAMLTIWSCVDWCFWHISSPITASGFEFTSFSSIDISVFRHRSNVGKRFSSQDDSSWSVPVSNASFHGVLLPAEEHPHLAVYVQFSEDLLHVAFIRIALWVVVVGSAHISEMICMGWGIPDVNQCSRCTVPVKHCRHLHSADDVLGNRWFLSWALLPDLVELAEWIAKQYCARRKVLHFKLALETAVAVGDEADANFLCRLRRLGFCDDLQDLELDCRLRVAIGINQEQQIRRIGDTGLWQQEAVIRSYRQSWSKQLAHVHPGELVWPIVVVLFSNFARSRGARRSGHIHRIQSGCR